MVPTSSGMSATLAPFSISGVLVAVVTTMAAGQKIGRPLSRVKSSFSSADGLTGLTATGSSGLAGSVGVSFIGGFTAMGSSGLATGSVGVSFIGGFTATGSTGFVGSAGSAGFSSTFATGSAGFSSTLTGAGLTGAGFATARLSGRLLKVTEKLGRKISSATAPTTAPSRKTKRLRKKASIGRFKKYQDPALISITSCGAASR